MRSVAVVHVQVAEKIAGCDGVHLVREPIGRVVVAIAVVAVERAGEAELRHGPPEVVAGVLGFGTTAAAQRRKGTTSRSWGGSGRRAARMVVASDMQIQ